MVSSCKEEEDILARLEQHTDAWALKQMERGLTVVVFDARHPADTRNYYKLHDGTVLVNQLTPAQAEWAVWGDIARWMSNPLHPFEVVEVTDATE